MLSQTRGSRLQIAAERQMKLLFNSSRYVPPTWTYECDEDLVHYFYDHIGKEDENLGSVKQCVTSIDVSSYSVSHMHSVLP